MKKKISYFIWTIIIIIIIIISVNIILPAQYNIQKNIYINSTPNIIFSEINKNLEKNKNLTVTEKNPFIEIKYNKIENDEYSNGEIIIENNNDSTIVYWKVYGEWPFYLKWKNITINKNISYIINNALKEIKEHSENFNSNISEIKIIKNDSLLCVYKKDTCDNNIKFCFEENLDKLLQKIKKDSSNIKIKYPYFIYNNNFNNKTIFEIGLILEKKDTLNISPIKYYYSDSMITCTHYGELGTLEISKKKIRKFISSKNYNTLQPIEIFLKNDEIQLLYLIK